MKKAEGTRDCIIEAAAPVFNKYGYLGTSLSDVLKQTTLTKGAIYHYFKNKDDLALAALEYNLTRASKLNFGSVKEKTHSCDKLIAFACTFKNNYNLMKKMGGCPVMNAAVDSDDSNKLIKNSVCSFINMWRTSIIKIIEQGIAKNEIRADVNAEDISLNFVSLIEGALAMSKVTEDKSFIDKAVDLVVSLIEEMRMK